MSVRELVLAWREDPDFIGEISLISGAFPQNLKQLRELDAPTATVARKALSALLRFLASRISVKTGNLSTISSYLTQSSEQELQLLSVLDDEMDRYLIRFKDDETKHGASLMFWHVSTLSKLQSINRRLLSRRHRNRCLEISSKIELALGEFAEQDDARNEWDDFIRSEIGAQHWWRGEAKVIFVHGTFGQGLLPTILPSSARKSKKWFTFGSEFHDSFLKELTSRGIKLDCQAFLWSGWNTVLSRQRAAFSLGEQLKHMLDDAPNHTIWIVGHSHGGNVAMLAASRLHEHSRNFMITTLATPFLEIYDNNSENSVNKYFMLYIPFAVLLFLLLVDQRSMKTEFKYLAALVFIIVITSISRIVLSNMLEIHEGIRKRTNFSISPLTKILILRSPGDEASMTLAIGSITARVSYFINRVLMKFDKILISTLLVSYVAEFFDKSSQHNLMDFLTAYAVLACAASSIVIFVRIIVSLIRAIVFGPEFAFATPKTEIESSSAPDSFKNATILTLDSEKETMRHFVYEHGNCAKTAVAWFCDDPDYDIHLYGRDIHPDWIRSHRN